MAEFPVTPEKKALVDQFPRLSDFAAQSRKEGYSDQEVDDYVRQKFILPATKEGHSAEDINKFLGVTDQPSFLQKLAAGPVGQGIQSALNVVRQIGGAPEAATPEGISQSYKASQEKIAAPMEQVFGRAGEPISKAVSGLRAGAGAVTAPFIPRVVQEGMGAATELAGRGVGAGARAIGLPEPVAQLGENLTPDVLTALLASRGARAFPQGLQTPVNELFKPREPAPVPAPTPTPEQLQARQALEQNLASENINAQAFLQQKAPQPGAPPQAEPIVGPPKPKMVFEVADDGTLKLVPGATGAPKAEPLPPEPPQAPPPPPNPRAQALEFMNKYKAEQAAKATPPETPVSDLFPQAKAPAKVQLPEEPPFDVPPPEPRATFTRQAIPEAGPPPAPVIRGGSPEFPFEKGAQDVAQSLRNSVATLEGLNERAKVTIPKAEEIATGGTFAEKPVRELFREQTGDKPETYNYKMSQADVEQGQAQVVATGQKLQALLKEIQNRGDPLDQNVVKLAQDRLDRAIQEANKAADQFKKQRFAAGRTVQQYNRAPIPKDVIDTFKDLGVVIDGLQNAKERLPIYTNILESMKNIGNLTPVQRTQLWKDFVEAFRLNLFSTTSFSLDMIGNATELAAQTAGGVGRDLVHVAKGNPTFPSIQGIFRAIKDRQPLPAEISKGLGETIGGERIRGGFTGDVGTFTKRETLPSKAVDYLVGTPLYAKGLFDTAGKRFSSSMTLWRDAIEAADKAGLKGSERQAFYKDFWEHPPQSAIDNAISEGKKAGYDRVLSKWEENVASNPATKLLVDAFARWPFQFARWAGEMVGVNPELFRKVKSGTASAEDVGGYLAKTATGLGGLKLLDSALYDHVDFNSMEYVHDNGDRTRLSGRDPIPTALFLLAVIHGDVEKATAALKNASIPFAKLFGQGGQAGLLGGIIEQTKSAIERADVDPKGLQRETTDTLNRAIPGQAVLSAVKTIFDPTIREGVGANIPVISQLLPAAVNPSTGEPLQPRQKIPGVDVELPSIGGTPIPGARRILDPVTQVLSKYGLMVYRGPKSTIAGFPAGEVPADVNREWMQEFGKIRADRLGGLLPKIADFERQAPPEDMKPGKEGYEIIRREISKNDAETAQIATAIVNQKHGGPPLPPTRKPTIRERRGPSERNIESLGLQP